MAKFIPTAIFLFYAILPTDFIADFIPVLGGIDDAAVLASCAYLLVQLTPVAIIRQFETGTVTEKNEQSPKPKVEIIDVQAKKKN